MNLTEITSFVFFVNAGALFIAMSKIHFLLDQKTDRVDDIEATISNSRQGWRDLVQRILNQQSNANIFSPLIEQFQIEESERVYRIHRRPLFRLPSRRTRKSKSLALVGSILRYSIIENKLVRTKLIPSTFTAQKNVTIMASPKWRSSIDEQLSKIHRENPNSLSRSSLRSISYGFGMEPKLRKTIIPSLNYQLPSNKIELDLNQQEIIRRMGSFKKSV